MITRLEGGAGLLALRGARALDPEVAVPVIVTGRGATGCSTTRPRSGIEVLAEPALREVIAPRSDLLALRAAGADLPAAGVRRGAHALR